MRKGILLMSLLFAATTIYAGNEVPGSKTNSSSGLMQSSGNREDMSMWASRMLDEVSEARLALKNGDPEKAYNHVTSAVSDLKEVNELARGSTMIPVYREFVSVSFITPVEAEQSARRAAEKGKTANARTAKTPAVVHQVAGDYTEAVVNTTVAKNSLDAAEQALDMGATKLADKALADVQEGVEIESTEASMPLVRARENLILARSAFRDGNTREADAALKSAATALGHYAAQGGTHAAEAKTIEQKIEDLANHNAENHSAAVGEINQWWNTTANWTPYQSESGR